MIRPCRLALLVLLAATSRTPAGDYVWSGGAPTPADPNSWQYAANFRLGGVSPLQPPGAGDRVNYTSASSASYLATQFLGVPSGSNDNFGGVIQGLTVVGPSGPVTINAGGSSGLTLNDANGIDLTNATQSLTLASGLGLTVGTGTQRWAAAAGQTITANGAVTATGRTLNLNADSTGNNGYSGTVVLANASDAFAGSTVNLRGGTLQLSSPTALGGGANGLSANPLTGGGTRAAVVLSAAGTYSSVPVTLASSSSTLRSAFQGTNAGSTAFAGGFTLSGGSAGFVELNASGGVGSTFTLSGGVGGGYTGTLQLGGTAADNGSGTGGAFLTGGVALSTASGVLRKQDAGTWSVGGAANAWATTRVAAGTLRPTVAGALPAAAALQMGEGAATGTLDLFGANQTVGGLTTTSDDTQVNPAGNQIGIGAVVGPGTFISTLTYSNAGGSQTFGGTVVNSVGGSASSTIVKTVGLTVSAGTLTLTAANTYSGATTVGGGGGAATLTLGSQTGAAGGGFSNSGSFAGSPLVDIKTNGSLNVQSVAGGANYDAATNQFSLAAGQTLGGVGQVVGGVTVPPGAVVRGGTAGSTTGVLAVSGGPVVLRGNPTGAATPGGQLAVDVGGTDGTQPVSRVAVSGGTAALNFDTLTNASGGSPVPVVVKLLNDQNLAFNTPVQLTVASAGAFQLNGAAVGSTGYTVGTDFVLATDRTGNGFTGYANVALAPDGGGNLILSFTPVPEPAAVLAVAAAGLGAVRLVRRRILAG